MIRGRGVWQARWDLRLGCYIVARICRLGGVRGIALPVLRSCARWVFWCDSALVICFHGA